jgi:two-component system, cell cycle sensor histidine kinase and response regulator CckA
MVYAMKENALYTNDRDLHNFSLLIREIGGVTTTVDDIDVLLRKLAGLMMHRLNFDRGLIMLANEAGTELVYAAGYGYFADELQCLQKTAFRLDNPDSKDFFVRTFLDRRHSVFSNADETADAPPLQGGRLSEAFGARSLLCFPILFGGSALGVLAVDNVTPKAALKQSDIHLLQGIAAQIAVSINNARLHQKLRESENRCHHALEGIEAGYFEIGLDRRIVFANNAFGRIVRRPLEQWQGMLLDRCFAPGAAERLDELFGRIRTSGVPVRFAQLELSGAWTEPLAVDLSASLVVDQSNKAIGFRGLLRDASDRLKMETERKELESQLLHAQKMEAIGTLASGIAHNCNNWLTGMLGNLDLIRMDARGQEKVLARIAKIEDIIENAAKMNRQLLGYARGEAHDKQPMSLNEIVRNVADTFAAAKKDIAIELDLAADLRAVEVDKGQIEQVLWNLFINAADAMPGGGRFTIRTANTTAERIKERRLSVPPGDYVVLSCADTGSGIAPTQLGKIFEPFFSTKREKGTGLGLASCFGIVQGHNGTIGVSSKLGVGTTFDIYLPAFSGCAYKSVEPVVFARAGNGTILVIDDEPMILETTSQLLTGLGYTVHSALGGEEALRCYANRLDEIDLVIIDMVMPGMNGAQCHARIREIKPDMKTVLCSGYSMNQSVQRIMDQGCNYFLEKPFTLSQVSEVIRQLLEVPAVVAGYGG